MTKKGGKEAQRGFPVFTFIDENGDTVFTANRTLVDEDKRTEQLKEAENVGQGNAEPAKAEGDIAPADPEPAGKYSRRNSQ